MNTQSIFALSAWVLCALVFLLFRESVKYFSGTSVSNPFLRVGAGLLFVFILCVVIWLLGLVSQFLLHPITNLFL